MNLLLHVWGTPGVPLYSARVTVEMRIKGSGYQFATASYLDLSRESLASGERGNEGIIHRPKDESEFLAKKKTFEANIFKFFLK